MVNRNLTVALENEDKPTIEDIASDLFTNDLGIPYTDLLAIGANPTATIFRDGTVVGSTDNGEYTRFANGNLEVSKSDIQLLGYAFATPNYLTVTFPVEFNAIPTISTFGKRGADDNNAIFVRGGAINSTQQFNVAHSVTAALNVEVDYIAKGRWK